MAGKRGERNKGSLIVLKREEGEPAAHHGGAWKVAYADFVTAMMAFFLLMWLINATTEDQRRGLADYFAPNTPMSHTTSGSGMPFGGHTPFDDGTLTSDRGAQTIRPGKATAMVAPEDPAADSSDARVTPRQLDDDGDPATAQLARPTGGLETSGGGRAEAGPARDAVGLATPARASTEAGSLQRQAAAGGPVTQTIDAELPQPAAEPKPAEPARPDRAAQEEAALERTAAEIRAAVRNDPALASLARQLAIDITPEGLRIQILDEDKQPMFSSGSSVPNERARSLLQKIAPVLAKLPEPISVTGHTDAEPYHGGGKSNWDLSTERANETRRQLTDAGVADTRFRSVTGVADRDPLLPADPLAAANRRIAITVLRNREPAGTPPPPARPPS
ncbi:MAG: OmpA family protein [Acidisphaera sp.]|nr:OmpA family protein [Acidisphaera sp.]